MPEMKEYNVIWMNENNETIENTFLSNRQYMISVIDDILEDMEEQLNLNLNNVRIVYIEEVGA